MKKIKRGKKSNLRLHIMFLQVMETQTLILNLMERGKARWNYSMIIWRE
jgi:hypothetical protein